MCSQRTLKPLAAAYNLQVSIVGRPTLAGKRVYRLDFCSATVAYKFLSDIYPFLVGKKNQARILLKYFRQKYIYKLSRGNNRLVKTDKDYYDKLVKRLKYLKKTEDADN